MDSIYTGAADLGKAYASIGLVAGIIFGAILIIAGFVVSNTMARKQKENSDDNKDVMPVWIGWVLVGLGALIIFISWLVWHFSQKNKAFAAAEGVVGSVDLLKNAFTVK